MTTECLACCSSRELTTIYSFQNSTQPYLNPITSSTEFQDYMRSLEKQENDMLQASIEAGVIVKIPLIEKHRKRIRPFTADEVMALNIQLLISNIVLI